MVEHPYEHTITVQTYDPREGDRATVGEIAEALRRLAVSVPPRAICRADVAGDGTVKTVSGIWIDDTPPISEQESNTFGEIRREVSARDAIIERFQAMRTDGGLIRITIPDLEYLEHQLDALGLP